MLVVSTPPKSTTSARICFRAMAEQATDGIDAPRVEALVRGEHVDGRRAAARLRADLRRALEPHLRGHRRRRRPLGAAPPAARQAARLRPRHGPRAPDHLRAPGHRGPGAAGGRPLRGRAVNGRPSTSWTSSRARSCARSPRPSEFPDEADRRAIGERVVDTLVAIHAVDPDAVGLGELAKKEDYVARQLHRWQGQWEKSHTRELPLIDEVHDRLAARIPEQGPATIVHGDYRLDNMILTPVGRGRGGRRLGAVHARRPARRRRPAARLLGRGGRRADPAAASRRRWRPGSPAATRSRRRYAERSGRDLSQIDFYVALGLWKLAIILEGVYARYARRPVRRSRGRGPRGSSDDGRAPGRGRRRGGRPARLKLRPRPRPSPAAPLALAVRPPPRPSG